MKSLSEKQISHRKLENELIDLLITKMEFVYEMIESGDSNIKIKDDTYKLVYEKLRMIWYNLSNEELVLLINVIKNQR